MRSSQDDKQTSPSNALIFTSVALALHLPPCSSAKTLSQRFLDLGPGFKEMKKTLLSIASVAMLTGSALAADLPSRKAEPLLPPPPPPPMWNGFYAGLNEIGRAHV